MYGITNLLLLIMVRIIAITATQYHGTRKSWMPEFAMRPFAKAKPACSKSETNWRIFRGIHKIQ